MLEKIGLPPKPSQRGSNWVVDASHCQGCSSQFTFINRKHHCRRCGGLFCNGCTQQRMALRGQGDSPVRICEPCKKLEEASRFEMRYGHKNRAGKGSSRLTAKSEDEVLNQILGDDGIGSSHMVSSIESARCTASSSTAQLEASLDEAAIHRSSSLGEAFHVNSELESSSPEKLRQKALDEKKRYRILKGEGKSDEALKAFKRGKELEREADALELSIRKNRKKSLPSGNRVEPQSKDGPKESGRKGKLLDQVGKEKVDLTAELRELGWSDMDVQGGGKGSANMSLEGELYSLLGDVSQRANKDKETGGVDKTQVTAHKRKALTLKREGKLAEAKEELKKAKLLERQLEEQELLGGAEDSDDEISALIRSMGDGKQDELLVGADAKQEHGLDFNHLINTPDDLDAVAEFDVTDEDMMDPEMADALKSLGWVDGSDSHENVVTESVSVRREALLSEILALKKEALNQKRAGNVAEAMAQLKKAKLLERDLESLGGEEGNVAAVTKQKGSTPQRINAKKEVDAIVAPKSKMMIQKELLALKKKALALRREGKLDEADEELKRGKVLEEQLEEMNNVSKGETTRVNVGGANPDLEHEYFGSTAVGEDGEEQVTDTDMYDPTYLSILRNLGWKDDNELANSTAKPSKGNNHDSLSVGQSSVTQASSNISTLSSRSSKADIQRELLSLKRKAFTLRREGKVSEAEEVLRTAKTLEARLVDIETPQKDAPPVESGWHKHETVGPLAAESGEGDEDGDDVTDNDMRDPSLLSVLTDLGWKDEELEPGIAQVPPSNTAAASLVLSTDQYPNPHPPIISAVRPKSKFKVQQELLGLKRKAFAFRRKGETEEAEELLKMAKVLEAQLEEMEVSESALLPDTCKDSASLNPVLKHVNGSVKNVEEKGEEVAKVAVLPDEKCVDSFIGFGSNTGAPPSTSSNNVIPVEPQLIEDNHPLVRESHTLGEMGALNTATTISGTGFVPPANQTVNMMDLLTGDDWRATQMPAEKPADKVNSDSSSQLGSINKAPGHLGSKKHEVSSVTDISSGTGISFTPDPHTHVGSSTSPSKNLASNDVKTKEGVEPADREKKQHVDETKSSLGMTSQINQSSLRQEVLAKKRKALALKREGKLIEAREELRQAKLLEKGLEEEARNTETPIHASSTSGSSAPVRQKEPVVPNVSPPKPLSGRDRFKLQQESLSHKRQALKLRREGRVEEAEAEFELAKALEAQLDELTSQGSKNSSNEPESADGVVVDDFLDPQLLSALKAIGIHDDNIVSQGQVIHSDKVNPRKSENSSQVIHSDKVNPSKSGSSSQERIQLEERIKGEKLKALNLKRSGKQAEALDALRQAKMFQKKLDSLT